MLKQRRATKVKAKQKAALSGVVVLRVQKTTSAPKVLKANFSNSSKVSSTRVSEARSIHAFRGASVAAYALFISLLLQPVAPVFANSDVPVEEIPILVVLPDESEIIQRDSSEPNVSINEILNVDGDESRVLPEDTLSNPVQESITTDIMLDVGEATSTSDSETQSGSSGEDAVIDSDIAEDPNATTTNVGVPDDIPDEYLEEGDDIDDLPDLDESLGEELASTTMDSAATTTSTTTASYVINPENKYQFAERECRGIGDGAFYCRDQEESVPALDDGVFTAPDSDGDLEIYVRVDGVGSQLTYNTYEDSAPYYDPVSERVVWHALVDDRYQIFAYELNDDRLLQVTKGSENNMQPTAYGDDIFWQSWARDNWEIMRFDGTSVYRLSTNAEPDIAPYAQDTYLMWQNEHGGVWRTALYDLTKGTLEYLDGLSEGTAKNPRLVLMYESYDEYGDVHTFGYDLKTKENISLSHTPASAPRELPKPDGEQEKRALVNAKPTIKDEGEDAIDTDDDPEPLPQVGTTTPEVDGMTLVIPPLTLISTSSEEAIAAPVLESLIGTSSTAHIEDVVILPIQ